MLSRHLWSNHRHLRLNSLLLNPLLTHPHQSTVIVTIRYLKKGFSTKVRSNSIQIQTTLSNYQIQINRTFGTTVFFSCAQSHQKLFSNNFSSLSQRFLPFFNEDIENKNVKKRILRKKQSFSKLD